MTQHGAILREVIFDFANLLVLQLRESGLRIRGRIDQTKDFSDVIEDLLSLSYLGVKNSNVGVVADIRDELLEGLELLRDGYTSP